MKGLHWRRDYWVANAIPPDQIGRNLYAPGPGFYVVPQWKVLESAFAWISHTRRLSKDDEPLCATREAWIDVIMIRLMLRRLARF